MKIRYLFSKNKIQGFENSLQLNDYYFQYNIPEDKIDYIEEDNNFFIIIGNFVDANDGKKTRNQIVRSIIQSNNIKDLIKNTRFLAGRYLILMGNKQGLQYVLPDPVGTVPVNYLISENEVMISTHQKIIADEKKLKPSKDSIAIKSGAEEQQPLPNDITMYEGIKTIIPNHYLNVQSNESVRFFPTEQIDVVDLNFAVDETIAKVKEIIEGFLVNEKLSIPLTSGIDSRTVLALFRDHIENVPLYTYYSDNFTDDSGDIKVPRQLSEAFNLDYRTMDKDFLPEDILDEFYNDLSGLQNENILRNGLTYKQSDISDYRPVPGDIISIAKSPFGKNLPEKLATLDYFMTKTHNYSNEIRKYIEEWMNEAKPFTNKYGYSLYDLYNWEFRLGRWLPNNIQNYDYFMQQVYIFNCRYLMELWISISRQERTERSLHKEIIQKEWPELLEYSLNPDEKLLDRIFDNSYMFYMGSFLKYQMKKFI